MEIFYPRTAKLNFIAKTDATNFDSVHWQVVNTGEEAKTVGQLRGSIFLAKTFGIGGLKALGKHFICRYTLD